VTIPLLSFSHMLRSVTWPAFPLFPSLPTPAELCKRGERGCSAKDGGLHPVLLSLFLVALGRGSRWNCVFFFFLSLIAEPKWNGGNATLQPRFCDLLSSVASERWVVRAQGACISFPFFSPVRRSSSCFFETTSSSFSFPSLVQNRLPCFFFFLFLTRPDKRGVGDPFSRTRPSVLFLFFLRNHSWCADLRSPSFLFFPPL